MRQRELLFQENESRRLIYEEKSLEDFHIYNDRSLNNLIYDKWLLTKKELRAMDIHVDTDRLKVGVFNDAYFICTIALMRSPSDKRPQFYVQKAEIPSLVMPLVRLYLSRLEISRKDINNLLKMMEGGFKNEQDWQDYYEELQESVSDFKAKIPLSWFKQRKLTKELLYSIKWCPLLNHYQVKTIKSVIDFVAHNEEEQKMMAKAIFDDICEFEYNNPPKTYIDDETGDLVYDSYDFSEAYQLCKMIMKSNGYVELKPNKQTEDFLDSNWFMPTKAIKDLLCEEWFDTVSSDRDKYSIEWRKNFVDALMGSDYGKYIVREWNAKTSKRNRYTRIKCKIVGALLDADVLKATYNSLAPILQPYLGAEVSVGTVGTFLGNGKKNGDNGKPFLEWIIEYCKV